MHQYLLELQTEELPKSPEGHAVRYPLKNWNGLTRYSEDGNQEIDDTATERSIRGIAVGRGNWKFFGSDIGGKTTAILRSFVASCQRVHIDPLRLVQGRTRPYPRSYHSSHRRTSAAQLGSQPGLI